MNIENEVVSLRRMVRLQGIVILAGVSVLVLMGHRSAAPQTITAERFNLQNTAGKTVGTWFPAEDGSILQLFGKGGKPLLKLKTAADYSTVVLIDSKGVSELSVANDADGSAFELRRNGVVKWAAMTMKEAPTAYEQFIGADGHRTTPAYQLPPGSTQK